MKNKPTPSRLRFCYYRHCLYFLTAVQFYSRLPIKNVPAHSATTLHRSRQYFPLVGLVLALIALLFYSLARSIFTLDISLLLTLVFSIIITGAFHEDGLADSFDAFGGAWNKNDVLRIMKDSRLGSYGLIALVSVLSIKTLALFHLANLSTTTFACIFLAGNTLSRLFASLVVDYYPYVQDIDASKIKPIASRPLPRKAILLSCVSALIPWFFLCIITPLCALIALLFASASAYLFAQYSQHRIGGYTGDTLGATQQLSEIAFYLACLSSV